MTRRRREEHERLDSLRKLDVFSTCSVEELRLVDSLFTPTRIRPGVKLAVSGAGGLDCLLVLDGTATADLGNGTSIELGPGSLIGEMALLYDEPRRATVTAVTPMDALVLTVAEFQALLDRVPSAAEKIREIAEARRRAAQ